MARVELARAAVEDLDRLVTVLNLPADTRDRVRRSLMPLAEFPRIGAELPGRWQAMRFVLGPWRWMLLVYQYREDENRVVMLTIQDARSSSAATGGQPPPSAAADREPAVARGCASNAS